MAQVKFKKIISCSSEDPDFPAKNILTCGEVPGAWKTANEGESQGTVVIQLDRKYKISQLEIKNEASAFIEVLVANQDENEEAKFQVLLSVSSFMTPNESKNLSNVNRLRVFAKDKLSPSALKQSFDLVKINCTQPFNKTIKYGISYMKIMEGDADDSASPISSALSIKNRVNDNKDDNTPVSPTKDTSPRAGTAPVDTLSIPNQKDDSSPSPNKKVKVATRTLDKPSTSRDQDKRNAKPKEKKTKVDQPFCQLMKGVTFTISGFQNPLRSEIRSKGLQMGAKYKGDWDRSCTHLICAFPNTPKFNQVNGTGGKIVTKEWIEESYDQRKLLPWKKYSLVDGGRASKKSSSEDEDDGEMDDFIVDDDEDEDEEEEEYDPKTKNELEDEDEDVNELGPVLPQKLRDNSPQRPRQPTLINSPLQNKSPKDNKVDKVKAKNNIKDEDYNSDDIYDAATDED